MRQRRNRPISKSASFDGRLHEKDARSVLRAMVALCLILAPLALVSPGLIYIPIGLSLGSFGGYMVTPDADHMGTTHEEYKAMRKFGFLGSLLVAWMTPYAYTFRHRSKMSHSIWPGTPIRFLWATLPLLLVAIALMIWAGPIHAAWYPIMLVSWSLQDIFHYKRDGLGYLGLRKRRIPRKA